MAQFYRFSHVHNCIDNQNVYRLGLGKEMAYEL